MIKLAISLGMPILTALACQPADDLPPVQAEGEIFSYAASNEVCDSTAEYGDRWMTAVGTRLGISPEELLPTTYYRLDDDEVIERCGAGGCARIINGGISIFDSVILEKHELAHAVHLSAWPRRRSLLTEGLAVVFGSSNHSRFDEFSQFADIDRLLEADSVEVETYLAGPWIVFWIIERHGIDAFRDFWHADSKEGSAAEFRALFELHFGESLDAMLADVQGQPACPLVTCVEDVVEWQSDLWATESPTNCDDGLTIGDESNLLRAVLLEVPESGTYTVSVSDSDRGNQGATIHPCGGPCGQTADSYASFYAGETSDVVWDAGLYRVTTGKFDADDPGIRVEIRPQ